MAHGEISLGISLADLVAGGGGFSELRFLEPNQEPVTIMTLSESVPALSCKICRSFLIITDLDHTESECVVCHTKMPAGVTSCPKCGWTYKGSAD
jgi:hypothetical protein